MLEIRHGEKVAVIVTGVLFVCAVVWFFLSGSESSRTLKDDVSSDQFTAELIEWDEPTSMVEWGQPEAQGGANWIFDIFTPPVIYYNEETGTFTVTPPFPGADSQEDTYELELVELRPMPYRFQLVSYAGARGNYVLTFEDRETGRDLFASPNEKFSAQGFEVLNFSENRVVAASTRTGTTEAFDLVGEALVSDLRSGSQYTLRHDEITYLEKPAAFFRTQSGVILQLEEGETWESENALYRLLKINAVGQTVTVEKSLTDGSDKDVKLLQTSNRFNTSDLSNRNTRVSESPPGAF